MSRNNVNTVGKSLYYLYHQNDYKLIGIDLSRPTSTSIPQQVNFIGKLEENIAIIFLSWKSTKNF